MTSLQTTFADHPPLAHTAVADIDVPATDESPVPPTVAEGLSARTRRLRLTSVLALVDQAIVSGANFGLSVLVKKLCDDAGLGLYSLGFSVLILVINIHGSIVVSPFTFFTHQTTGLRQKQFAGSTLILHLLAMAVGIAVAIPIAAVFASFNATNASLAWAVVACVPCWMMREFSRRVVLARLRIGLALILDSAITLLMFGFLAWLVSAGQVGPASTHLAVGIAMIVVSLSWLIYDRREFVFNRASFPQDIARSWSFGAWVCADQVVAVASVYAAHWVLQCLLGEVATGQFAACMIVAQLANPILFALGNILEPKAGQAVSAGGTPRLREMIGSVAIRIGLGMSALSLGFALLGPAFVRFVFKNDFQGMNETIVLLAVQTFAVAFSIVYQLGLRAAHRSGVNLLIGIGGLAVTLMVALTVVPFAGVKGAALAQTLGYIAMWLARWHMFRLATAERRQEVAA